MQNIKEISKLISICRKSGIKAFKHGDIEFSFHESAVQQWPEAPNAEIKEVDAQDLAVLEESKMAQLLLEDPAKYEELLAEKLLKN